MAPIDASGAEAPLEVGPAAVPATAAGVDAVCFISWQRRGRRVRCSLGPTGSAVRDQRFDGLDVASALSRALDETAGQLLVATQ